MATNEIEADCSPEAVFAVLADGWLYPTWVVGAITAALSAYKLAQKVLPVLGWRKFEVH